MHLGLHYPAPLELWRVGNRGKVHILTQKIRAQVQADTQVLLTPNHSWGFHQCSTQPDVFVLGNLFLFCPK